LEYEKEKAKDHLDVKDDTKYNSKDREKNGVNRRDIIIDLLHN
jgi:hypothetical protein